MGLRFTFEKKNGKRKVKFEKIKKVDVHSDEDMQYVNEQKQVAYDMLLKIPQQQLIITGIVVFVILVVLFCLKHGYFWR